MGRGAYRVISSSRSASQWRTCGRSDPARILEADASETPSCRLISDTQRAEGLELTKLMITRPDDRTLEQVMRHIQIARD